MYQHTLPNTYKHTTYLQTTQQIMEFPQDLFKEIVSFTGPTKKEVFETGEYYYKVRNELIIYKVLRRTKCYVVLQVMEGNNQFHDQYGIFRKRIWSNPQGRESIHIEWETLHPSDKITGKYNQQQWKQVKKKIIAYCVNKSLGPKRDKSMPYPE